MRREGGTAAPSPELRLGTCVFTHVRKHIDSIRGVWEDTDMHYIQKKLLIPRSSSNCNISQVLQQIYLGHEYDLPFVLLPNFFLLSILSPSHLTSVEFTVHLCSEEFELYGVLDSTHLKCR